jgi:ATPase family associated with various cellular activities (AAA)
VSSAIVDKYIGESARLIREMFCYARDHQPCIIFMDEIDAIGLYKSVLLFVEKFMYLLAFSRETQHDLSTFTGASGNLHVGYIIYCCWNLPVQSSLPVTICN